MEQTAKRLEESGVLFGAGRVKARDEDRFWVETEWGRHKAQKAFGCLLEPEVQDKVLVALVRMGEAYILSVLKREDPHASVVFQGDARIVTQGGDLGLSAARVRILGREIKLSSLLLGLSAGRARAELGELAVSGRTLRGRFETVHLAARTLHSFVDRAVERLGRSYRFVEGLDQTVAGRLTCLVKDALLMKGRRSSLLADKKIKIDADKIHLG